MYIRNLLSSQQIQLFPDSSDQWLHILKMFFKNITALIRIHIIILYLFI